jgi:glutamate---cysteine ligase / carboxylate-amine ligase
MAVVRHAGTVPELTTYDDRGARHVGVEEEMLLIGDSRPLRAVPAGPRVIADPTADAEHELKLEQVETASDPTAVLADLRVDLRQRRDAVIAAAAKRGVRVAALGSCPAEVMPTPTPDERYERMGQRFGVVARDQLTCGTHVHVAVESRGHGVAAIDRIRPWLAVLTAISANSPFWSGEDTGYASYRTIVWGRWPTAGPTELFGDETTYDETVAELIRSGAALDRGMIYFDARLSASYPTVEIRVADVCQDVADTVLLAALSRAIVDTALHDADHPPAPVRTALLRAASWRAARFGLSGELLDLLEARPRPAADLLDRLLEYVGPALARTGDAGLVHRSVERVIRQGTSAQLQRAAMARRGRVDDVVADAIARTAG